MTKSHNFFTAVLVAALSFNGVFAQENPTYENAVLKATNNTIVASEAPGIVRSIEVQDGSDVKAGAVLVRLNEEMYTADFQVAVEEFKIASLQAANRVNIEYAKSSAEVTEATLVKSQAANREYEGAISSTEIDRLELDLKQAVLSGDQAEMEFDAAQLTAQLKEKQLNAAKVQLENRKISAPFGGKVAQVYVQKGQWVNTGEPIARVIDLSELQIEAYLAQNFYGVVKVGAEATFDYELAGTKYSVPAKVVFVAPEILERRFRVKLKVDNRDQKYTPGVEGKLTIKLPIKAIARAEN